MLCNVLGCLHGSEDTRKTPSILSRKIRALGVLCVSCSLPSRETARRGGGVTKAIESRGRTALSRRCQCGRDCLRLGVARGRRREVAQMIRLIG